MSVMQYSEIFKLGYFEAHRIHDILNECRARDLEHLSRVIDASQATDDYRNSIHDWLKDRQPRMFPVSKSIPPEVLAKFAEAFKNGGRQR